MNQFPALETSPGNYARLELNPGPGRPRATAGPVSKGDRHLTGGSIRGYHPRQGTCDQTIMGSNPVRL
jgi:hypothetical protein